MEQQVAAAPAVLVLARLGSVMRRAFAVRMAQEAWASEAGMRPGCYSVLRAVSSPDAPTSQRSLGEQLGIDPSDLVGLIDVLEGAGYVDRQRDPADRRRYAVVATPAGAEALARFDRVAGRVADDVFGVLGSEDREVLEGLLEQVVAAHEGSTDR